MVGRYFDERPFVERWRFSKDPEVESLRRLRGAAVPPHGLETYVGGSSRRASA